MYASQRHNPNKPGLRLVLALLIALGGLAGWAPAQTPATDSPTQVDRHQRDDQRGGKRHGRHRGGPGRHRGGPRCGMLCQPDLANQLLKMLPADEGPLREGEAVELLDFARQNVPRIYRALRRLERRDPQRYEAALEQHAPRLRHMRRVFDLSPRMGEILKRHAANGFRLGRAMRAMQRAREDSPLRERAKLALRTRLAGNVRLEIEGLEVLAEVLEQQREERIDQRLTHLTGNTANLSAEPEQIRDLVAAWHAADQEQREDSEEGLIDALSDMVDAEIAALRERADRLRQDAVEVVDRRLEQMLECATSCPARGPGERGRRHGPGRRGERRGHGFERGQR